MWEIAKRCNVNNVIEDYQLPFSDIVQQDPSIEDMRKVSNNLMKISSICHSNGDWRLLSINLWQLQLKLIGSNFKVVCENDQRPTIPPHWHDSHVLHKMSQLMKDCWYKKPASRLTSLRTKKTLASINSDEKFNHLM